jgi:undecaprenyl diphosphate synthase
MSADDVTPEGLRSFMPSLAVGDPDLVIRTGGERRISNFLLYGLAYAELFFVDALWPDFGASDLYEAIASYQRRERRFGLIGTDREEADEPVAEVTGECTDEERDAQDGLAALTRIAV